MDFAVPAHYRVKLKESEKKDKYLYPVRELKKLGNMKVTVISIVLGALSTVTKGDTGIVGLGKKKDEWRPSKLQLY